MKKAGIILTSLVCLVGGYLIYLSYISSHHEEEAVVPFTVMDILHATDLENGIKEAVKQDNDQAISDWLEKAEDVAEQVGLPDSDLDYLRSSQAKNYVIFNAKRQLFNEEFEQAYYALEGIDGIKQRYPEAKDLFDRAETLLKKRDQIIEQIALTLSNGQTPDEEDLSAARALWQQRYQTLEAQ
ncbi:hypothetical protein [Alteromonas sp. 14N.309.X.WAT.G.H12]|uniref:hypothetical protein n=1 Tax=Alteromonas sp. 14N.309.X.WAT.G.H12 TaxID=3120824 RepID=UPI002FD5FB66